MTHTRDVTCKLFKFLVHFWIVHMNFGPKTSIQSHFESVSKVYIRIMWEWIKSDRAILYLGKKSVDQNGRSSVRKRPVGPDILILSTDPRTETGWPGPGPAKFRKLGLDRILKIPDRFGPVGPRTWWSVYPWFYRNILAKGNVPYIVSALNTYWFVYSWAVVPIYIKITQVFILNCLLKY